MSVCLYTIMVLLSRGLPVRVCMPVYHHGTA